ncbi:MAG TPA: class I SAM-dependent methyltransferase [Candidatus Omnitrophota bacterium]|nr:class I SAM-dependent methyltransferase [Candidatus Omnitrophota bacterium]
MGHSVIKRKTCRICNSRNLECALKMPSTPVGDSYVTADNLNKSQESYSLDLFICRQCTAIQLMEVVDPTILYGNYIYETSISKGLVQHFEEYSDDVINKVKPLAGQLVVDIGSNDGTLLKFFKKQGLSVLGIDPAPKASQHAQEAGIETWQEYFSPSLAQKIKQKRGCAKIITANNVFANIDDLGAFINGIKTVLDPSGYFVFETGYGTDLIKYRLVDTIYHEHLSYFTVLSLQNLFNRYGMVLTDVERISSKGGSLRCFARVKNAAHKVSSSVDRMIDDEKDYGINSGETYERFSNDVFELKRKLLTLCQRIKSEGKTIAGYGASVGVTTLIYLFELADYLSLIVDDNPARFDLYTPGHHLPVMSSDVLYEKNPDYVLILAWRYQESIIRKHQEYLNNGGQFIVPQPEFMVINQDSKQMMATSNSI